METVSDIILHEYPYPIAKCYERLVRTRDVTQRRDKIRYLFEATLKYCACLSIGQYLSSGRRDPLIDAALGCLARPSLGHWLNLSRQCGRHSQPTSPSLFSPATWEKTRTRPAMLEAFNVIRRYLDPERTGNVESVSPFSFLEAMVAYRNKTSGHGAPQQDHIERFTPILEAGVVDLLHHLAELKTLRLVYLSEIRVERQRFVHTMTSLMGNTPLALPDYLSSKDEALIGQDRTLVIFDERNGAFLFTLHPLLIYASDSVFILQACDLKHSVEYLCHDTGSSYLADHVFEDFKERLGPYVTGEEFSPSSDGEATYESCLKMSLLDGVIGNEERLYLDELREELGLSRSRAEELEKALTPNSPVNNQEVAPSVSPTDSPSAPNSIGLIVEQQTKLLKHFGEEILRYMSGRAFPEQPIRLDELAAGVALVNKDVSGISKQQFAHLMADVLNHGFAPGLVKSGEGYAIVEDHIAFKLTRGRDLKREIAKAATRLLKPGDRIGLDGGSTTLPIGEEIVSALESEMLDDLTIVTNSLQVAQCFADFVEGRGWSDRDSPVTILIATGQIRAITKAIANLDGGHQTEDSLEALIKHVGGLDFCFVGANGITVAEAITMPTDIELPIKQQFISAARQPYIVADVTKFGLRYPIKVAGWDETLTVLTNKPAAPNGELDAVLELPKNIVVTFADLQQ
jgi:DeoR/GlpR family transcriptional regulator of sugar metabolism